MFENIRMVMVNTTHPGNIGAAARALKNMGFSRLVLVDPKEYPSERATWRAANALDVLEQVEVVDTLDEAITDCSLVIGTSARERRIPWPLLTPRECGDRVWSESEGRSGSGDVKSEGRSGSGDVKPEGRSGSAGDESEEVSDSAGHQVAIVFGREDRGLTNEELQKCHFHVHIPANPEYSSLNIASAMQVIAYEIRMSALAAANGAPVHFDDWDMPPAQQKDMELYYAHLQETLEKLTFINADNPRQTLTRLRRLYNRIRMDQMELSILRGILTSIQNYMFHTDNKIAKLEARVAQLEAEQRGGE